MVSFSSLFLFLHLSLLLLPSVPGLSFEHFVYRSPASSLAVYLLLSSPQSIPFFRFPNTFCFASFVFRQRSFASIANVHSEKTQQTRSKIYFIVQLIPLRVRIYNGAMCKISANYYTLHDILHLYGVRAPVRVCSACYWKILFSILLYWTLYFNITEKHRNYDINHNDLYQIVFKNSSVFSWAWKRKCIDRIQKPFHICKLANFWLASFSIALKAALSFCLYDL